MGHHCHRPRETALAISSGSRTLPPAAGSARSITATSTRRRPKILAYRNSGGRDEPGWRVRVVPNKFPVLGIEGELNRQGEGMYDKMNGIGAHEVIIETPGASMTLGDMPEQQIEEVLWAFRDRVNDLKTDRRFRYIILFKNHGEAAGASLEHPHSQLIALPVIPKRVQGGGGRRQAVLRDEGALHFLRHHPAGDGGRRRGW